MEGSMDERIISFIKKYKISNSEIDSMLVGAPMLDVINYDEFVDNCKLLIQYGYPKSDLDFLMLSNPNIFTMSFDDLKNDLKKLIKKYGDIEQILKQDPTII